jgi:hypothetical protein
MKKSEGKGEKRTNIESKSDVGMSQGSQDSELTPTKKRTKFDYWDQRRNPPVDVLLENPPSRVNVHGPINISDLTAGRL